MLRRYAVSAVRSAGGRSAKEGMPAAVLPCSRIGAQLVGGLFRDAGIRGEPGALCGAARVVAVAGGAMAGEQLLREQRRGGQKK